MSLYIITHTYTEIMAEHDTMRYIGSRWCLSTTMQLACTFTASRKQALKVVALGAVVAPLVYHESLSTMTGKKKKVTSGVVAVTTYSGVFHVRYNQLNCTIASKLDDFDALTGLSQKYEDLMDMPETLIGMSTNLHVCVSKYLVF